MVFVITSGPVLSNSKLYQTSFLSSRSQGMSAQLVNQSILPRRQQWSRQDISNARAQHGYATIVRNSAQSAEPLGDLGHAVLENVWDFTTSQVDSEAISSMGERMRFVLLWIYIAIPHFSMVWCLVWRPIWPWGMASSF